MKLLHTADWHLGKSIYGRSLLEDQEWFITHNYLPALDEERPDGVLLCGDVFDRAVAPPEALRLFDRVMEETCQNRGIPLFVISGNHDGPDRMAVGGALLRAGGVYLSARLGGGIQTVPLQNGEETVHITLLPYFDPAAARKFTQNPDLRGFSDSFDAVLEPVRESLPKEEVSILLAHCFVAGGMVSDSESSLYVGGSGEVSAESFTGFTYAALGHLHAPQKTPGVGRYAGSPLKYSFDEEHQQKSMTVLEIHRGQVQVKERKTVPLRDLRTVQGTIEDLLAMKESDDYLFAQLEGPPVFEPMEKLRRRFPNILGLRYVDRQSSGDGDRELLRSELRDGKVDDTVILQEFFKQMCADSLIEEDMAVFSQLQEAEKESGGDNH